MKKYRARFHRSDGTSHSLSLSLVYCTCHWNGYIRLCEISFNIYLNDEIANAPVLTRSVGCVPLAAASCSRFSSSNARRCCLLTDSTSFMPRCCCSAILLSAASACFLRIVSWIHKRGKVSKVPVLQESVEIIFERPGLWSRRRELSAVHQACHDGLNDFSSRGRRIKYLHARL